MVVRYQPVEVSGDLDRTVMQDHQLSGTQAQGSVGVPVVIAELDLEHARSEAFYHGADLAPVQTLVREVFGKGYNI